MNSGLGGEVLEIIRESVGAGPHRAQEGLEFILKLEDDGVPAVVVDLDP